MLPAMLLAMLLGAPYVSVQVADAPATVQVAEAGVAVALTAPPARARRWLDAPELAKRLVAGDVKSRARSA